MVRVAGEVAEGLFVHPFSSPHYVRAHVLPEFGSGLADSGRSRADVTLACALLTATGCTDQQIAEAAAAARRQIAFYASTPAYLPVLETHGLADLQPRLAGLVKAGRWDDLAAVMPDDVLTTFALVGTPSDIARQLVDRWDGVLDRVSLVAPRRVDEESWSEIHDAVSAGIEAHLVDRTNSR
jgi:probable F420-dependent oxidoreductase